MWYTHVVWKTLNSLPARSTTLYVSLCSAFIDWSNVCMNKRLDYSAKIYHKKGRRTIIYVALSTLTLLRTKVTHRSDSCNMFQFGSNRLLLHLIVCEVTPS